MGDIYQGDVCLTEQEEIYSVVARIETELPIVMTTGHWEKLQDIICLKSEGMPTKEWTDLLAIVSSHSKNDIDLDKLGNIIENLKKIGKNKLEVNESFCSTIDIHLTPIKNEYKLKIVGPIQKIINEWDDSTKKQHRNLGDDYSPKIWESLYRELKNKTKLFINSLWKIILEEIVFKVVNSEVTSAIKGIDIDKSSLYYDFEL